MRYPFIILGRENDLEGAELVRVFVSRLVYAPGRGPTEKCHIPFTFDVEGYGREEGHVAEMEKKGKGEKREVRARRW